MALGASGRRISAVTVVVVVVAGAVKGTAAAVSLGVAAPAAAAADLFFAIFLGGPEESEGLSSHQFIAAGGGADFLFRGRIGSLRGGVFFVALQLLLEQELEVFPLGLGFVLALGRLEGLLPQLLLTTGLAILLATPVARVAVSWLDYVRERDWLFAGLTLVVLVELAMSILAAIYGIRL